MLIGLPELNFFLDDQLQQELRQAEDATRQAFANMVLSNALTKAKFEEQLSKTRQVRNAQ